MRAFALFTSLRYALILAALLYALRTDMPGERLAYVFSVSEIALFAVLAVDVARLVDWRARIDWRGWIPCTSRTG